MARVDFKVPELHCEGCARRIRKGLEHAPGARAVKTDVGGRRVTIEYDPETTTPGALRSYIYQSGFETGAADAPPEAAAVDTDRAVEPEAAEAPTGEHRGLWYALVALSVAVVAVAGYVGYELYPRFDLPAVQCASLFLLAAGAGIASFFSPCAFPLLVTVLARETGAGAAAPAGAQRGDLGRAFRFAAALSIGAATFLLLGGLIVAAGGHALFAGFVFMSPEAMILRAVVGGFLVLLGLVQLGVLPNPLHAVETLAKPILRLQAYERRRRAALGFGFFGFGYLLAGFG